MGGVEGELRRARRPPHPGRPLPLSEQHLSPAAAVGKAEKEGEGRRRGGKDGVECNGVYIEGRKKERMNPDRSIVGV